MSSPPTILDRVNTAILFGLAIASSVGVVKLALKKDADGEERTYSLWAIITLGFYLFYSVLSILYDLVLKGSPFDDFIQRVKAATILSVFASNIFCYFMLGLSPFFSETVIDTILFLDIVFTLIFSLYAFSGGFPKLVNLVQFSQHITMLVILGFTYLLFKETGHVDDADSKLTHVLGMFTGAVVIELISLFLIPFGFWIFHLLLIVTVVLFYQGAAEFETYLPVTKPISLRYTLVQLGAFILVNVLLPTLSDRFRYFLNTQVWNTIYAVLLKQPMQFPPVLHPSIESNQPRVLKTSYNYTHPRSAPIAVTCTQSVPLSSQFHFVFIKIVFHVIYLLDRYFPQARVEKSIFVKPRLKAGEGPAHYAPQAVSFTGAAPVTVGTIQQAKKDGQLLAYLVQFGHASTMIHLNHQNEIVLDLDFMKEYEMKKDYKRYGGRAYLRFNKDSGKLEVTHVSAPDSNERVVADPNNKSFRQIEDIILASSLLNCVVGRHCDGIHSYMNMLAVSLHNAFDTTPWQKNPPRPHPVRVLLYIHCYNHIMVEELTTGHLLDKTGIFSQIFGYTHNGLAEYYNSFFNNIKYAEDADLETREKIYGNHVPENSQLHWERIYHNIHLKYATKFVDIFYRDDQAVNDDNQLQSFRDELNEWLPNKLPARHDFRTKHSLARFIADTMHVFVIRHEIYGTNTVKYALDPTIMSAQVPIDHGLPAQEEYYSLLMVAYATSRVPFGKMMSDNFKDLLPHFPDNKDQVAAVFAELQSDYKELEERWTANNGEREINQEYMRNIPSDLETGAGY